MFLFLLLLVLLFFFGALHKDREKEGKIAPNANRPRMRMVKKLFPVEMLLVEFCKIFSFISLVCIVWWLWTKSRIYEHIAIWFTHLFMWVFEFMSAFMCLRECFFSCILRNNNTPIQTFDENSFTESVKYVLYWIFPNNCDNST